MLLGGMLKCAEHGYRMIFELVDTHNDHVTREINAALVALQPDGVILTPPHSDNPLITGLLTERKIPFARIGSLGDGGGIPLIMGDEGAARMATRHLINLGHSRIGFITGASEYALSHWREAGWRAEMAAAGLDTEGLCQQGDFGFASGYRAAKALLALPQRATAIIASSDAMAMATITAADEQGMEIPDDISLISFDNTPMVALGPTPLTAIDQPIAETAARATELLIAAKRGEAPPTEPVIVPAGLIERGSTAPVPGG
jgi:LacI family transcriptional regulator